MAIWGKYDNFDRVAQVELTNIDKRMMKDIAEALGLKQKDLVARAAVKQSWLSQALSDRYTSVDGERLEKVARVLVEGLSTREPDDLLSKEGIKDARVFLSRFTDVPDIQKPTKTYHPGGIVDIDADFYIEREADEKVLSALQEMPFTMLVRGPVQCGKSSVLARLQRKAKEIGFETVRFEPPSLITDPRKSSVISEAITSLAELLQAEWNLQPSRKPLNTISELVRWIRGGLERTASKPRILIIDDLASLGADALEDWANYFIRPMHNERALDGPQVSFAIGVTHLYGKAFERRLLFMSSLVNWKPRLDSFEVLLKGKDLDNDKVAGGINWWMDEVQVEDLEKKLTGGSSESRELHHVFQGQPYLTHVSITDEQFWRDVRVWLADPSEINARPIRGAQAYRQHLNAIRLSITGPTWSASSDSRRFIQALNNVSSNDTNATLEPDDKLFLQSLKLVDKSGSLTLQLYKLIAQDLLEAL